MCVWAKSVGWKYANNKVILIWDMWTLPNWARKDCRTSIQYFPVPSFPYLFFSGLSWNISPGVFLWVMLSMLSRRNILTFDKRSCAELLGLFVELCFAQIRKEKENKWQTWRQSSYMYVVVSDSLDFIWSPFIKSNLKEPIHLFVNDLIANRT